ncbi:hypothetical protein [Proteiniborus sp. MB09-C3]|uniref:hypothetical protein n=1 Tax=Proteiniborus sp. MB09-C3 TaxID=3050072 RepID=UPI0025532A85|nr:hypothetical protein [Proteiniborus sp. MB09-C3]WIV11057.1 hypothetical protein QO263_12950 [Proteiniborus sp. MB09-C3]
MAIYKFYQIYISIKEVLGEDMAIKLFPEYSTLPNKMPSHEQARLGKVIIDRMDKLLDKDTIVRVRQKHTCNPSKQQIVEINRLKEKCNNLDDFCAEYSKFLAPGYVKKDEGSLMSHLDWVNAYVECFAN